MCLLLGVGGFALAGRQMRVVLASGLERNREAIVAIVVAVWHGKSGPHVVLTVASKKPRHRGAYSPVWERSAVRYRYQGAGRKAWSLYGRRGC